MNRLIKRLILEQADRIVPDKWEAIRTGVALPTRSAQEKFQFHRRLRRKYALAVSICLLILSSVFVLTKNFEFGLNQSPEILTPSSQKPSSQNPAQSTQDLTEPSKGELIMTIHINNVDAAPKTTSAMFDISDENIHSMTRDELFKHYAIQPFDIAEVLDGMNLVYGGFCGGGYGIYKFPSGGIYDANSFQYHHEGTKQHVGVVIKSEGTTGYISEDQGTLLTSEVNGIEMTITHYTDSLGFAPSDEEVWIAPNSDMYYAWFEYKGLGFFVSGANLSENEFTEVLQYLTSL